MENRTSFQAASVAIFTIVLSVLTFNMLRLTNECRTDTMNVKAEDFFERISGSRRDPTETEIESVFWFQIRYNIPILCLYYVISLTMIMKQDYQQTLLCLLCIWYMFDYVGATVYTLLVGILSGVSFAHGKRTLWCAICVFYAVMNSYRFQVFVFSYISNPTQFLTALAWIPLKTVSASADQNDVVEAAGILKRRIIYTINPTNLVYGPFVAYDELSNMESNSKPGKIMYKILRCVSLLIIMTFGLQYLHFTKFLVQHDRHNLTGFDMMTCVFFSATFFSTKVISLYGVTHAFLSDDFTRRNGQPICVAYIYDYRNLLRRFDVTLYRFFTKYIIGNDKSELSVSERVLRQGMCFLIVGLFHGASNNIIVWCLINFIVGQIRKCAQGFCSTNHTFGHLLVQIPLTVVSMISSILFLVEGKNHWNLMFNCISDLNVWIIISAMCVAKKIKNPRNVNDF